MKSIPLSALVVATLALAACGKKEKGDGLGHKAMGADEVEAAKAYKHPLAEAYYKENPDFFVFKQIEDLPADLKWENGAGLPEIGSPKAKKGGHVVDTNHEQETNNVYWEEWHCRRKYRQGNGQEGR